MKAPFVALAAGAKIWDGRTGKLLRTLPVDCRVQGFTSDGNVFGRIGVEFQFWNMTDQEPIHRLSLPAYCSPRDLSAEAEDALEAVMSPNGKRLAIWRLSRDPKERKVAAILAMPKPDRSFVA